MRPPNTVISEARNHQTPIFPVGMPVAVKVSALVFKEIHPTALPLLTVREADPAAASPRKPQESYTHRGCGRRPGLSRSCRVVAAIGRSTPRCWPAMGCARLLCHETG